MEKEVEKVCSHTPIKIFIVEIGKMEKSMEKELMYFSILKVEYYFILKYAGEYFEGKIIKGEWILSN